jgi:hypothetical protein
VPRVGKGESTRWFEEAMSEIVVKVKEEIRKILVVALFFSIGFSLIHISNRLLTAGSSVKLSSLTQAIIGGLVVAKVLASVDLIPFVHAFPGKPLVHNVVWKSSLYLTGGVLFLYIEPFAKNLFKGAGLSNSHFRAWQELMLPKTWATLIWVAMLVGVFVTIKELSRVIGKDQMKHLFFGRKSKPALEDRFRDAA